MKQKILLTGASGAVGREALKQMVGDNGLEITVFDLENSNTKKTLEPYKQKINIIYGDITNKANVEEACKNVDVVIHLAAIIPPLADEKPQLAIEVNAQGTANIIAGLEKHSPQSFLLYSSSVSVYGHVFCKSDE